MFFSLKRFFFYVAYNRQCRGDRGCSLERWKDDRIEDAYSASKLALSKTKVSGSSRIPGSCRPTSFTEHSLRVLRLARTTKERPETWE